MTSKKTWAVPVVTVLAAAIYGGTALATPSRGVTTSLLANKIAFVRRGRTTCTEPHRIDLRSSLRPPPFGTQGSRGAVGLPLREGG
jgi:hypothetical protein